MKVNIFTITDQTQEFILRLFIEPDSYSTPSGTQCYTCAHAGTHARLHQ